MNCCTGMEKNSQIIILYEIKYNILSKNKLIYKYLYIYIHSNFI